MIFRRNPLLTNGPGPLLMVLPLAALLAAGVLWPLLWLGVGSVRENHGGGSPGWTLARYAAVFTDRTYREAAVHSLVLSLGVAAGATALCLAPAALLARRTFPGQALLRALFTVPMAFSGIIVGFLTVLMLGRVGFLTALVARLTGRDLIGGSAYGVGGLLAAYAYFEVPRATLTLESALRKLDPRLDHVAASLGAGRWKRWRWVGLPLLAPALLETFALTFNVALGSFGVVLVVSKRFSLLPLETFHEIIAMNNLPQAAALAALLAAVALGVNGLARVFANRMHRLRRNDE